MALGYESWVQIGTEYALGTGTAVPRARSRMDSASGYAGKIDYPVSPITAQGLGSPHNYDWEIWDGSADFEVTRSMFLQFKAWILDRFDYRQVQFSTRKDNLQAYAYAYLSSLSISASEGSLVTGSLGFTAPWDRSYTFGGKELESDGYIGNALGAGLLCPLASGMPAPLNKNNANYNPVPSWYTKISMGLSGVEAYDFLSWSLDFSQDVVNLYACNHNVTGPEAPSYLGLGPLTVTFGGAFMWLEDGRPTAFPADSIDDLKVEVAGASMSFKNLELNTNSDDVQSQDSTTPVNIEYNIYQLSAA
jgi:hypothetical protein